MKNKTLTIFSLFVLIAIACNDTATKNKNNTLEEIQNTNTLNSLEKESIFYAKAEDFNYTVNETSDNMSILAITINGDMNCKENNNGEICKEILDWINGKSIIFRSTQEFAKPLENKEYYSLEQKGKIKIGSKEYSTQLFYNSTIEKKQFRGKLIFQVPNKFKSLKGVPISIDIKGKKEL